jgi:hypothetical protein
MIYFSIGLQVIKIKINNLNCSKKIDWLLINNCLKADLKKTNSLIRYIRFQQEYSLNKIQFKIKNYKLSKMRK